MIVDLGTVAPGSTLYLPFHTFDSNDPSASVTLTGLATTDIEIYKDGSVTQRASDAGYALLDTDGIDFDGTTGIHGLSVDLADNTTAGFYAAGSQYWIVVASVTVDAATINFVLATFKIGYEQALVNTTIATLASQTSFTLTAGSADDDAYNGWKAIIHDVASAIQLCVGYVSDYTGATKTVTLAADPGIFTVATTDNISLIPPDNVQAVAGTTQTAGDLAALVTTVDTVADGIQTDLSNGTDGLGALKTLIDAIQTDLDNGTDGLGALKALIDTVNTDLSNATDGLGAIKTDTAAILADTGTDGVVLATDSIDAAAIDVTGLAEFNTAIMGTALTEAYAADAAAATATELLYMIWSFLHDTVYAGTTKTSRKLDNTPAMTHTLDDATNPTSVTRAT